MENSRLFELLRTFSPAELAAFGKYLRSPYFNQREDVLRLLEYYVEYKGARQPAFFAAQKLAAAVFPGEPYDEKKIGYARSFLYQAAQSFLVHREAMQLSEAVFQTNLARLLRERGLSAHAQTALKKAEDALTAQGHRDISYHQAAHQLYLERFESEARQRRSPAHSFQDMAQEADLHFVANKLRQGCTAHVYRAVSEAHYRLDLLHEALALVEQRQWQALPAIGIYYYAYRALTEAAPQPWFERLRKAMNQHFQCFDKAEMRDIYTLAVNYCIRQINTKQEAGQQEFHLQQVFALYQEGLERKVFLEGGKLSLFTYNNIANAGLGLKAFDWVAHFLEQYKDALEPKQRESAYRFNLASLHFRRSNYGEVLTLLTQTDFDDLLHQLDARRMLLRSYYELGEFNALDSLLDSFQAFLRRRRDVGYLRQNYLNLIRLTKKLLQTPTGDRAARDRLRTEAATTKALAEREWLLAKI